MLRFLKIFIVLIGLPVAALADSGLVVCGKAAGFTSEQTARVYDPFAFLNEIKQSQFQALAAAAPDQMVAALKDGLADGLVYFTNDVQLPADIGKQGRMLQEFVPGLAPQFQTCALVQIPGLCNVVQSRKELVQACLPVSETPDLFVRGLIGSADDSFFTYRYSKFTLSMDSKSCQYALSWDFSGHVDTIKDHGTKLALIFDAEFDKTGQWDATRRHRVKLAIKNGFVTRSVVEWFDVLNVTDRDATLEFLVYLDENIASDRPLSFAVGYKMATLRRQADDPNSVMTFDFYLTEAGQNVSNFNVMSGMLNLRKLKVLSWDSDTSFQAPISVDSVRMTGRDYPKADMATVRRHIETVLGPVCAK